MPKKSERTVPAANFVGTLFVNAYNLSLDDKSFREFVKRTLPIVIFDDSERIEREMLDKLSVKTLRRVFTGKEVIIRGNDNFNYEMGSFEISTCKKILAGRNGSVLIKLTSGKSYSFIPDSSSKSGDVVEGAISPNTSSRRSIELRKTA